MRVSERVAANRVAGIERDEGITWLDYHCSRTDSKIRPDYASTLVTGAFCAEDRPPRRSAVEIVSRPVEMLG